MQSRGLQGVIAFQNASLGCEVQYEDVIVLNNLDTKSPRLITPEVLKIIHGIPRDTAKVPKDKDILDCPGVELVELQPFILAANP